MKNHYIHSAFLSCLLAIASNCLGDVLLWQVNDSATVDGMGIYQFISAFPEDEANWCAARVRVSGGSLSSPQYLAVYGEDESGNTEFWDGDVGVALWDNGSGFWGTGMSQSPLLNGVLGEYLFAMELGHNVWDSGTDAVSWTTLAETAEINGEALARYTYERFSLYPPTQGVWTPTEFHTVPEPSSLLAMLIGIALILLQRETRG